MKAAPVWVALFVVSPHCYLFAEEQRASLDLPSGAGHDSVLSGATDLGLYNRPYAALSQSERSRLSLYGLRGTPLHPAVWGVRGIDRTYSRNLVPIRAFYLRESEQPGFKLQSVGFDVSFSPARKHDIQAAAYAKSPVLELGFAGVYEPSGSAGPAKQDAGYYVLLSAVPDLPSGLYYRSLGHSVMLAEGRIKRFKPGRTYRVSLQTTPGRVQVLVNDLEFVLQSGNAFQLGLVHLISDWHPVMVTDLLVTGSVEKTGLKFPVQVSGLVDRDGK